MQDEMEFLRAQIPPATQRSQEVAYSTRYPRWNTKQCNDTCLQRERHTEHFPVTVSRAWVSGEIERALYIWKRSDVGRQGWVRITGANAGEEVDGAHLLMLSSHLSIEVQVNDGAWHPVVVRWKDEASFQGLDRSHGRLLKVSANEMLRLMSGDRIVKTWSK